jgi:uncharacterized membrane protein YkoI
MTATWATGNRRQQDVSPGGAVFEPMRSVLFLLLLALPLAAVADDDIGDYERARRAVEQGAARPLGEILPVIERRLGGRVIEVRFEREGTAYVYEFELITTDGRIVEATVDATTGNQLKIEHEGGD